MSSGSSINTGLKWLGALLVLALVGGLVWLLVTTIGPLMGMQSDTDKLLQTGVETAGQIVALSPTESLVNNQPVAKIKVTYVAAGTAQTAEFGQVIPMVYLPQIQPGQRVTLRVDKEDVHKVAVDLSQLASAPASAAR